MKLARIISNVANPILIFIVLPYFLVLKTTKDNQLAWIWTMYTLGFITIFAAFILVGIKKKFFSNLDVSNRKERHFLYLVSAILAIIYIGGLITFKGPPILFITMIGIVFGIFAGSLINLKLKASVHVAAITALITALSLVYRGYFILLFLIIPVICWSRVKIKRHSVPEVIVGTILGVILAFIIYYAAKFFIDL